MSYGAVDNVRKGNTQSPSFSNGNANGSSGPSGSEASPSEHQGGGKSFVARIKAFYDNNIGLFFVFLAQMFASIVSLIFAPLIL